MRLITTYILVACIALLVMTGCESDSDSSTEPVSEWATIDSIDFQVFIGDFSGYNCMNNYGMLEDEEDTRDWIVHDYDSSETSEDYRFLAYPNPCSGYSTFYICNPTYVDLDTDIVLYNQYFSDFITVSSGPLHPGDYLKGLRMDEYDLTPGLHRLFIRMVNEEEGISKWGYGDIMYDPDFEW